VICLFFCSFVSFFFFVLFLGSCETNDYDSYFAEVPILTTVFVVILFLCFLVVVVKVGDNVGERIGLTVQRCRACDANSRRCTGKD
jgi:hypothetical protein